MTQAAALTAAKRSHSPLPVTSKGRTAGRGKEKGRPPRRREGGRAGNGEGQRAGREGGEALPGAGPEHGRARGSEG